MKTDTTMQVSTPEQWEKLLKILGDNDAHLLYYRNIKDGEELKKELITYSYVHIWLWGRYYFTVSNFETIDPSNIMDLDEEDINFQVIDVDFFIQTNGTCGEE